MRHIKAPDDNDFPEVKFILCLLYPGESQSISEANDSGLQTRQCPIGQVAREILAAEDITPKERRPELQRGQQRRERPI